MARIWRSASREAEGGGTSDWSFLRLLISRGSRALGKMLLPGVLGLVSDPMTGFFVVRRTAIQDVVLAPCGYKILVELLVRSQFKNIVEVGYVFRSRQRDESKASVMVFVDYVQHLLRLERACARSAQERLTPELASKPSRRQKIIPVRARSSCGARVRRAGSRS